MMRISCLLLCFVLFSLCNSYALRKLKFHKRVDPENVPNQFNLPGIRKFNEKGLKLVEGDIAAPKKAGRNAYIKAPKWPNGIVPYEISADYTSEENKVITGALATIMEATDDCIQFVARTDESITWLSVFPGDGCWSMMGQAVGTGEQQVSLQKDGCVYHGIAMHEFLHALGFAHEQTRPDRDQYVKINLENIEPGMEGNFQRYTTSEVNTLGVAYDYGSIMQYRGDAFTKNGKATIVPIEEGAEIQMGQRTKLSDKDIEKLKIYYECQ